MFAQPPDPGRLRSIARIWRALIDRGDVLIVDTETTGLLNDPSMEVIEVAAVDTRGATRLNALSMPEGPIPARVSAVHGLTAERLEAEGARRWPAVHARLERALAGAQVVLAYNAAFDRQALERTAARHGLALPRRDWHCILTDARALYPGRRGKLGDLVRRTGAALPEGRAHRALYDCRSVLALMRAVVRGARPAARAETAPGP